MSLFKSSMETRKIIEVSIPLEFVCEIRIQVDVINYSNKYSIDKKHMKAIHSKPQNPIATFSNMSFLHELVFPQGPL